MKLIPNISQFKKWSLPAQIGYISFCITLIGLVIALITIFTNNNATKEDIKKLPTTNILDSILSAQLKSLTLPTDIKFSKSYKGYSYQMMIYLDKQKEKRRKFIFDSGDSLDKNRISFYLDEEDNLCFRIIDATKEVHTLKIPQGKETFRFNELMFLICEYAKTDNNPFMKVYVNLKDIGNQELPFSIKLTDSINLKNTNVGCDLSGDNCLSFVISLFSHGRETLTTNQKISFFNASKRLLQKLNPDWSKNIRD